MEMSPQLARLVAWLEEMHARVMQAEQAALAVMGDMPAYTARMQEKARLLASLEEEGEAYLEELPEQLQDQAGHRLHRFSASARNALRIGSIFYMSALLYPEEYIVPVLSADIGHIYTNSGYIYAFMIAYKTMVFNSCYYVRAVKARYF